MRARWTLWAAGWLAVAALLAWSIARSGGQPPRARQGSLLERLLGPVASLAASAQWVRVDLALRRGETARAYARAETALRLDPGDPEGWIFLAHHFLYERASLQREPDAGARARWIRAGLDTLERGEPVSRDPGALLFERGVAFAFLGSLPETDRAWPPTSAEAWRLAADAFERAAAKGYPHAGEAAGRARGKVLEGRALR